MLLSSESPEAKRMTSDQDPTAIYQGKEPDFDAPTEEAKTQRKPPQRESQAPKGRLGELREVFKDLLKRHEKKIWWLHTFYALGLGAFVATFAQKGLERARWLALSLAAAWLIFLLFFRFFGTGARQDFITAWPAARRRFFVMTYVLKNLFQGMLFFLLPFYWKSTTWDGPTWWFVVLVGGCAILSTLDLVFDRLLMRWKLIASLFYAVALFGASNLVIPAIAPNTPTLHALLAAAGLTVAAFWLLHVPLSSMLRKGPIIAFVVCMAGGIVGSYFARSSIPPVPMYLASGGVGPKLLEDDDILAVEVRAIHVSELESLTAVTAVQVMGNGDRLTHVWKRKGEVVHRVSEPWPRDRTGPHEVKIISRLTRSDMPKRRYGPWTVNVETSSGQLVGRVAFDVID